jgi:hypothetical protein
MSHSITAQVTLHSCTGEDISPKADGSITRELITDGEKYLSPIDETLCTGMSSDLLSKRAHHPIFV